MSLREKGNYNSVIGAKAKAGAHLKASPYNIKQGRHNQSQDSLNISKANDSGLANDYLGEVEADDLDLDNVGDNPLSRLTVDPTYQNLPDKYKTNKTSAKAI